MALTVQKASSIAAASSDELFEMSIQAELEGNTKLADKLLQMACDRQAIEAYRQAHANKPAPEPTVEPVQASDFLHLTKHELQSMVKYLGIDAPKYSTRKELAQLLADAENGCSVTKPTEPVADDQAYQAWLKANAPKPAPAPTKPAPAPQPKPVAPAKPAKPAPTKPVAPAKPAPTKPETAKPETAKPETAKPETAKPAPISWCIRDSRGFRLSYRELQARCKEFGLKANGGTTVLTDRLNRHEAGIATAEDFAKSSKSTKSTASKSKSKSTKTAPTGGLSYRQAQRLVKWLRENVVNTAEGRNSGWGAIRLILVGTVGSEHYKAVIAQKRNQQELSQLLEVDVNELLNLINATAVLDY